MRFLKWHGWATMLVAALVTSCGFEQSRSSASAAPGARFERQVPWTGKGVWLKAEFHAHTRFTDGGHTVEEVVAKAVEFGCDVVAITDHGDAKLKGATPEYHAAIAAARAKYPQIVVITGMEWNVPPGKGDDHATLLLPQTADELSILGAFKQRFDDYDKRGENPELADEALRWLDQTFRGVKPVILLNHPSRKVADSVDVLPLMRRWRGVNALVAGFEGAPGHQKATTLGAYGGAVKPMDRWDPVAAVIGGVWDQLLAEGVDVWAASASADFHNPGGDYWPGEFAETWVYAADRSVDGVLAALTAGSYFAGHGGFAREATLQVTAAGLPRPAEPGEQVRVRSGASVEVTFRVTPSERDMAGQPGRIDGLEIIGVPARGVASVLHRSTPGAGSVTGTVTVPAGGISLRARGFREQDGARLWFYTNPIRLTTGAASRR